jgi:hypothetical protein
VKTARWITCFIGLGVFVTLGNPRACAQAEIDPDHYETRDAEPLPLSKAIASDQVGKIRCEGNFLLPSSVRCSGSSLPRGKFSISVDSEGRIVRVTLIRGGRRVNIEGIPPKQNRSPKRNETVSEAERKTP